METTETKQNFIDYPEIIISYYFNILLFKKESNSQNHLNITEPIRDTTATKINSIIQITS